MRTFGGLGGIALGWLLSRERLVASGSRSGAPSLRPRAPHFAPQAKSVIFVFMGGGPSQVDLFDPKPALGKYHGKDIPIDIFQRGLSAGKKLMASPFQFSRHGQSGIELSELIPHLGEVVDDIALIRSAKTNRIDHDNAQFMFNTGRPVPGFPSLGSWVCYGLGSENENLPAYVALMSSKPNVGQRIWASGWLPPLFQGTRVKTKGVPIFDLNPPRGVTAEKQRRLLDYVNRLNRIHQSRCPDQLELEARIANFELAARMQTEVMRQVDISREPKSTQRLYGLDQDHCRDYGVHCLLARRLVESGVRFVHIISGGWDHHSNLENSLRKRCAETDKPVAGLLADLKSRGLLDSTLVIWGGEFGRLPIVEGRNGRDHNPHGFSLWMAGGGIRGGAVLGATDDFGYAAAEDTITPSDVHATVLHLLGLDHENLTYPFEGRHESLVGVNEARILNEILV